MGVLKVGEVKKILHDAGVGRVSRSAVEALSKGMEEIITEIGKDAAVVYPEMTLETHGLERLSQIKAYTLRVVCKEPDDIDIKELTKRVRMPEGWDEDDDDEGGDEDAK